MFAFSFKVKITFFLKKNYAFINFRGMWAIRDKNREYFIFEKQFSLGDKASQLFPTFALLTRATT